VRRMKYGFYGLILVILVLCAGPAAGDLSLVEKGQPRAIIVIGAKPSQQARDAASALQRYLQKATNVSLPIVKSPEGINGKRVLVGQSAARSTAKKMGITIPTGFTSRFKEEGYVVVSDEDVLILAGNETEPYSGTLYAVYDFLESLGYRWYFPGEFGEVVPHMTTISLPSVKRICRPVFRIRNLWYSGHLSSSRQQEAELAEWKQHNRYTPREFYLSSRFEEGAHWLQDPSDDTAWRLLPKEKYFKSRPELYALSADGSRNPRMPCPSSDEAVEEAAQTIAEHFREHPELFAFAFSPEDRPVICYEPNSIIMNHGSLGGVAGDSPHDISDVWFGFVNRLAKRVKELCPDKVLGTMAYANRIRPPEGVYDYWDNVYVQIAPIGQCPIHSYIDKSCEGRQRHAEIIREWSRRCMGIYLYDYDPHDWTHLQQPKWGSRRIAEDYRFLASLNGWGFNVEGQNAWLSTGLNYWIRGKLAWDVELDPSDLVADFCERFFGPAAAPMRRYYDRVENALYNAKSHYPNFTNFGLHGEDNLAIFSRKLLNECGRDLREAAQLVKGNNPYEKRVAAFQVGFDRVELSLRAYEAAVRGDYAAAVRIAEKVLATVKTAGDSSLLQDHGPWRGSWDGETQKERYENVASKVGAKGPVAVFPQQCLFREDPYTEGVIYHWYSADHPTSQWQKISTTKSWATQNITKGCWGRYQGIAWYRANVRIPAEQLERPKTQFMFPGITAKEAWVWVNGRIVGYWKAEQPIVFDITSAIKSGDNLFAIRINGDGGLWLPPVIW